jgi:hypothetical protein
LPQERRQAVSFDIACEQDATAAVLDGCRELAQSCMDYKAALEDLRDQLLGILEDLAIELAVTATIAILASCVTFGAGAAAGTAKAAHTISKFAGIINRLSTDGRSRSGSAKASRERTTSRQCARGSSASRACGGRRRRRSGRCPLVL